MVDDHLELMHELTNAARTEPDSLERFEWRHPDETRSALVSNLWKWAYISSTGLFVVGFVTPWSWTVASLALWAVCLFGLRRSHTELGQRRPITAVLGRHRVDIRQGDLVHHVLFEDRPREAMRTYAAKLSSRGFELQQDGEALFEAYRERWDAVCRREERPEAKATLERLVVNSAN